MNALKPVVLIAYLHAWDLVAVSVLRVVPIVFRHALEVAVLVAMAVLIPAIVFVPIAALMDAWDNVPDVENHAAPSVVAVLEIAAPHVASSVVHRVMMTARMDASIHACSFVLQPASDLVRINASVVKLLVLKTVCISARVLTPEFLNRSL